jgi:hypothetical protein
MFTVHTCGTPSLISDQTLHVDPPWVTLHGSEFFCGYEARRERREKLSGDGGPD